MLNNPMIWILHQSVSKEECVSAARSAGSIRLRLPDADFKVKKITRVDLTCLAIIQSHCVELMTLISILTVLSHSISALSVESLLIMS